MGKVVGITYDLKEDWIVGDHEVSDANAEFDKAKTVEKIVAALESGGHRVKRIGNVQSLLSKINQLDVDIVFNICEGREGRNRESQVPLLLEMNGIPFVGADALTLGVTLDKSMTKKVFMGADIPTPDYFKVSSSDQLPPSDNMKYPLIVKTSHEGTSKGIHYDSRVESFEQLKKQVDKVIQQYNQPALIEEFIIGQEFTVAVLGNENPEAMPIAQISIEGSTNLGMSFYSHERVYNGTVEYICPAQISKELAAKIQDLAVKTFRAVDCRDLGRVDFRVDEKGSPYVLEINPLPSLDEEDVFNIFPNVMGSSYNEVINRILNNAVKRYEQSSLVTCDS